MSQWWWAAVAAVATAACSGPAPGTVCSKDHPSCDNDLICDQTELICRHAKPPQMNLNAPTPNQVLSGTTATVSGTVGSTDGLRTLSFRFGDGGLQPTSVSGQNGLYSFSFQIPVPQGVDGNTVPLVLQADVPGGDPSTETRTFPLVVDTVAPSVLELLPSPPPDRGAPRTFTVKFTEPVTPLVDNPVTLTPSAIGPNWSGSNQLVGFSSLEYDTPYTATLAPGSVADQGGNVSDAGFSLSFVTEVHPPARLGNDAGVTFGSQVKQFDVAFDQDGVLTLAVVLKTSPNQISGYTFDSRTGEQIALGGATLTDTTPSPTLRAAAYGQLEPSGGILRYAGYTYDRTFGGAESQLAIWRVGDGGIQTAVAEALIPVPPAGCETGAADSVGLITDGGQYLRAGQPDAGWTVRPQVVSYLSGDNWETADVAGSAIRRQVHLGCTSKLDSITPSSNPIGGTPDLSGAATVNGRRVYLYTAASGDRSELCCTTDDAGICGGERNRVFGGFGWVATEYRGGLVLGARANDAADTVELLERDATDCTSSWNVLGSVPGRSGIADFRPVLSAGHPALLYLTTDDGALRLYVP